MQPRLLKHTRRIRQNAKFIMHCLCLQFLAVMEKSCNNHTHAGVWRGIRLHTDNTSGIMRATCATLDHRGGQVMESYFTQGTADSPSPSSKIELW